MSGIIAGEGCIFNQKESRHKSVYISVTKIEEKEIYFLCLKKLGIKSHKWKGDKLVVSKNQNLNCKQIAQKFNVHESIIRRACKKYNIKKSDLSKCKIPQEKIQRIIEIYKQNPIAKILEVCKEVQVSDTVVRRVKKEHNLEHLGYMHLIGNNNKKYKNCIVLDEPSQKKHQKTS